MRFLILGLFLFTTISVWGMLIHIELREIREMLEEDED